MKSVWGADGVANDTSATTPLPVSTVQGGNTQTVAANGGASVSGCTAHDAVDAGNPLGLGLSAVAHGAAPTAVAAGDRTRWYGNRHGIPFVIGGHPNVVSHAHSAITTAVTNAQVGPTLSAGQKMVLTGITATLDNASTVFPTLLVGFGASTVPALGNAGVVLAHGGVPAGGGVNRGDGSGILAIGGDGEELRVTTTGNATGNGLQIVITYYLIES